MHVYINYTDTTKLQNQFKKYLRENNYETQRQIGYWVMFLCQLTLIYGEILTRHNFIFTGMTSKLLFTNFIFINNTITNGSNEI